MKTQYQIVTKENGKFGLQRVGGVDVFGNFDSFGEAVATLAEMNIADETGRADPMHY